MKCRSCGTPIFIDPPAQEAGAAVEEPSYRADGPTAGGPSGKPPGPAGQASSRIIPPPAAPAPKEEVACDRCGSRYRVEAHVLQRKSTRLKCSRCGHLFSPPSAESRVIPPQAGWEQPSSAQPEAQAAQGVGRVMPPGLFPAHQEGEELAPGPRMPLPDERRLATLFDDLQEEAAPQQPAAKPPQPPRPEERSMGWEADEPPGRSAPSMAEEREPPRQEGAAPRQLSTEQAYLEAISLSDDDLESGEEGSGLESIPDSQKYKLFLNPSEGVKKAVPPVPPPEQSQAAQAQGQPSATRPAPGAQGQRNSFGSAFDREIHDLTEMTFEEELPHPDTFRTRWPGQPQTAGEQAAAERAAPQESPAATTPPPAAEPPLGHMGEAGQVDPLVAAAAKKGRAWPTWPVWLMVVGLLGGASFWTIRLYFQPFKTLAFRVEEAGQGEKHGVLLEQPGKGRFLLNQSSGKRLYVVEGVIENGQSKQTDISWVQVKAVAFSPTRPLAQGFAYAGNTLSEQELIHWDLPAIRGYYGYKNGRRDANMGLQPGKRVTYQVVLEEVPEEVERVRAHVASYLRNGKQIFQNDPPKP